MWVTAVFKMLIARVSIIPFRVFAYVLHATGLERIYKPRILRHAALFELNQELVQRLPKYCYTITGAQSDPMNLVIVGDERSIKRLFRRAGWHRANPASPIHVLYGAFRALFKQSYNTGPFAPLYVNIALQDLAYQRSSKRKASYRDRHHLRLWRTGIMLGDGNQIWVGASGHEDGMKFSLAIPFWTHSLDPNIDAEREYVSQTLESVGGVRLQTVPMTPPILASSPKQTVFGSEYFTDGRAVVIEVPYAT